MISNLKVSTKVIILALVGFIGLLIVSSITMRGLKNIGSEVDSISEYLVPLSNSISKLEKDILKEEILTLEHITANEKTKSKNFEKTEKSLNSIILETDSLLVKVENLANSAIEHANSANIYKYKVILKEVLILKKKQKEFEETILQFKNDVLVNKLGKVKDDIKLLKEELHSMEKEATKILTLMNELLQNITKTLEEHEHALDRTVTTVVVIVFILLSVFSYLIIKNLKNALNIFYEGLDSFFKYLNRERSDVKLLDESSKDEFGQMSKVINISIKRTKKEIEQDRKVIDDTITVLSEFEKGDLCQRVNTTTTNPALNELTLLLNKMGTNFESNIDGLLDVLDKYSANNYLSRVNTEGIKEHLLKLADGINNLGEVITKGLIVNQKNGFSLQASANTLKQNVEKLSVSSNNTAASLEETAAALEEITSNVISSSDSITLMANYATKVTESASNGEKLANDTMSAMDEINEQVNSINEAIIVIDQIAFQTNILSLNAAVEAATAGEAGKGFAVVAQEVRNLASRSAEAAKEIKDIVENATIKANTGKEIAEKMLNGYEGLNTDIDKTIELIKTVDTTYKEQEVGIQQINDAITQLDQQTQENSASAMESSDVANTTEELAKTIIEEVESKQFRGKNDV